MTDFSELLRHGAAHAWLYIPSAMLLGALHGLEPGHSKTMMAAFIIAVRGTVAQAALLGLSAAFSHSLIIWLLAAVALKFGSQWNAETTEPYFQLASGLIILALALWMFWRIRRDALAAHDHHHHDAEPVAIPLGANSAASLSIFEDGVPPVFRLAFSAQNKAFLPEPAGVRLETRRPDGTLQSFAFAAREGFLESTGPVPEPHEFAVTLSLAHGDHSHSFEAQIHEHSHEHAHGEEEGGAGFQDAHELAHARDIEKRFANRQVTTGQIVLFGLTGGLLPCPAAFTVLIVCLQLKEFTLGFALVAAFSLGLAITMVSVGTVAAWSVNHAQKKFSGFGEWMRRAPYFSCLLLSALGFYMAWQGWLGIARLH